MSEVTFRAATADDLPAIVALLDDDDLSKGREDPSLPLADCYRAGFDAIAATPNNEFIVTELDGAVVGTMQLSYLPGIAFRGGWRGQIEAVRVASHLRGSGIGAQMIDWAVERCRARGCFMVQLFSQNDRPAAHRFYERLGWKRSHYGFKRTLG